MLHYRTHYLAENKPWVTLIHGAGGNSAVWFKQLRDYKKQFNVLLIDLRGHGKSQKVHWKKEDNFITLSNEVMAVLDHLNIRTSHFVGISLGTIVIQTIAQQYPKRVESMVLGGAITGINLRTKCYLTLGHIGKYVLPYMWIYRLFAWIIMPRKNHKEARITFVEQAKGMCQKQFIKWFSLTQNVSPFLKELQQDFKDIPTLFIMGEQDYLFLDLVEDVVLKTNYYVRLECIENAGHVCNIDQSQIFNEKSIHFMLNNKNRIIPVKSS
ncbi:MULTISPECIES: alpha/beta fold hydrolase [Bacillus]|uniref:alpha/beta fold hydrolase n=1 Tax=Bacillus TaxID=1386 RepID=UPI000319796A|nr:MULTISPECIES: alpha/beta hydrolase [Bacillus]